MATNALEEAHRRQMDALVAEWRDSKEYQTEVLELLRPDLEKTLGQVHDYKQFVQQVIQNLNVVLESRYPGLPLKERLDAATHEETAIYWAARLMEEKIDAAVFLDSPARIHEPREQGHTSLHGLVLKYIRIYQRRADASGIVVRVTGESWGEIGGNTRALGIIPHTLIDNALKYAPSGTEVVVNFSETPEAITLTIEGFGPAIREDEYPRLFDLFFRAEAARTMSSEGTGFGLASAQNIAKAHDTEIAVRQTDRRGPAETLLTSFSIAFPRANRSRGTGR